ncbi:FecCD family ABC transporter permease [Enterococcus sp. HY326]|uniref:FecCD family ABC transporter permease n=1 Tax=Enterococcus sp. HY326 TaxID=2971265 RepID=UPI00223FE0D8|nr:iron ABC transporter permease [Enterococcus sp. HY326]
MQSTLEKRKNAILLILGLLFVAIFILSFFLGKYPITFSDFFQAVIAQFADVPHTWDSQIDTILFNIRFPRIVMAVVIGAGISVAGATYQALFQNPMISQDILGASQGAAFGAAIALFFSLNYSLVIGLSFVFGIIAVLIVLVLDKILKNQTTLNLILIGMLVGTLFSSAISYLKLVGDPLNTLPAITYWLMGSLSSIKITNVYSAVPLILLGMLPIFLLRWRLNVMTLGEEEAASLGVNTQLIRLILIFSATLITAAAVSVSGLIGWVGLVVPHFSRLIIGNDNRHSLPATALTGAIFLLIVDDLARTLTTSEIPIGILTSFIGAPIFLSLIARNSRREV